MFRSWAHGICSQPSSYFWGWLFLCPAPIPDDATQCYLIRDYGNVGLSTGSNHWLRDARALRRPYRRSGAKSDILSVQATMLCNIQRVGGTNMSRPFIPVPNCALIEMVYLFGNKIIINTFHVQKPTPYTASDLQDMTQNRFDAWDGVGANRQQFQRAGGCNLQQVTGRALDTASSPVWIYTLPTARPGSMAGGNLPNSCTFAITLQTGLAGRSYRGRIYWPGLAFNHIQSGSNASEMQAVNANIMVTSVNALIAQLQAMTTPNHLCVVSYRAGLAWRTTGVPTNITNAAYADLHLDSQRRRLLGR